jgi:pSer/pThr/pTyr-binding forkhead associated (FHA) protein
MSVELVAVATSESKTLDKFPAMIGDQPNGGFQLDSPTAGSYHCLISRVDNQLVVWDLGTPGGTFVNGARVTKASLRMGDTLRLGGNEFTVKSDQHKPRHYLHGVRS